MIEIIRGSFDLREIAVMLDDQQCYMVAELLSRTCEEKIIGWRRKAEISEEGRHKWPGHATACGLRPKVRGRMRELHAVRDSYASAFVSKMHIPASPSTALDWLIMKTAPKKVPRGSGAALSKFSSNDACNSSRALAWKCRGDMLGSDRRCFRV